MRRGPTKQQRENPKPTPGEVAVERDIQPYSAGSHVVSHYHETEKERDDRLRTAAVIGHEVSTVLRRPSLAACIARVRQEVAQKYGADNPRLLVYDPIVELACISVDQSVPIDLRVVALDRVRRYFYAELKPEDPADANRAEKAKEAMDGFGARLRDALRELDGKLSAEPKELEGEAVPTVPGNGRA